MYRLCVADLAMVPLTITSSAFEAQVLCARLGADGILTQMRGDMQGPYPLPGLVTVLVEADHADDARQLLLGDQVEAVFEEYPQS
jgi:hypothetical protein